MGDSVETFELGAVFRMGRGAGLVATIFSVAARASVQAAEASSSSSAIVSPSPRFRLALHETEPTPPGVARHDGAERDDTSDLRRRSAS